jgi:hypothetical protein
MSRRLKILTGVGIALGLAILLPIVHHYQLRFAVEKYIAELKAKGEPMELTQVIPPPTPSEQNGVPLVMNALTNLATKYLDIDNVQTNPPQAMRGILPGKAIVGWQQPNLNGWPEYNGFTGTNTWTDLGRQLAAAKSDLNSFQSLTNHPVLDFNLDYQNLRLSHLGWLKISAQWLSVAALYDLHQGNPKNAYTDVRSILAVVKGETDERPTISQLVRIAIAAIGASATWEILQKPNVTDDDLAQLQQPWQSLEFITPLESSMLFERFSLLQSYSENRASTENFDKMWGYSYAPDAPVALDLDQIGMPIRRSLSLRKWDELRWRWFWSYQDELFGLKSLQVVIDAGRTAETNKSFQSVQSFTSTNLIPLNAKRHSVNPMNGLRENSYANSLNAVLRKALIIDTARNVVVSAIALKRYELRHHQFPATLDELTPDLLKAVPIDCMDGQPLRYRLNADGTFLLYSVGENGVDDGGNPALEKGVESSNFNWQNPHALDWVWPQPATEAEIQKYYEEQGKKSGN